MLHAALASEMPHWRQTMQNDTFHSFQGVLRLCMAIEAVLGNSI